jgi:predicted transglutaminase-like cysteine proteinase
MLFALMFIVKPVLTGETFRISANVFQRVETKYGKPAVQRLRAWEDLIRKNNRLPEHEKLKKVNQFFNARIEFVNDIDLYGKKDYWATPIEFICRQAGDCEDFAIAKYFTLKAMGVEEKKLNITYVKALQYNIRHMVLTYYKKPGAEPLILDNLVDGISLASRRTDLLPIFSFNGTGLWLAKQRGKGQLAGRSRRIKSWGDLLQRMSENQF